MEKQRKDFADDSELHFLDKELSRISKALSNLLNAIEAGIFTETIKTRLQELEAQKRELEEKILTERSKVKATLSQNDIEKYLKYALKQKAKNLIELLIDKVTVFTDKIYIDLKYTPDGLSKRPKKNKNNDSPDEISSLRGCPVFFLFSIRKTIPISWQVEKRSLSYSAKEVRCTNLSLIFPPLLSFGYIIIFLVFYLAFILVAIQN